MKLISKKILACAVGVGLLTFATGSAQAVSFSDSFITVLDAQLIIKWTDDTGKIHRGRITSKDLVTAIGEDFDETVTGEQIVFDYDSGDYWLATKKNVLEEDLSEDDVIVADYNELSVSDNDGSNGKFKHTETGTLDFEFYSDGVTEADVLDDEGVLDDNTLEFIDDEVSYTYTTTGGAVKNNSFQQVSITEKDGLNGDGHDFDITVDFDDLPIFGIITQNGSGKTDFFE